MSVGSSFFGDGTRQIDFVLAYNEDDHSHLDQIEEILREESTDDESDNESEEGAGEEEKRRSIVMGSLRIPAGGEKTDKTKTTSEEAEKQKKTKTKTLKSPSVQATPKTSKTEKTDDFDERKLVKTPKTSKEKKVENKREKPKGKTKEKTKGKTKEKSTEKTQENTREKTEEGKKSPMKIEKRASETNVTMGRVNNKPAITNTISPLIGTTQSMQSGSDMIKSSALKRTQSIDELETKEGKKLRGQRRRTKFQKNLIRQGLEIEVVPATRSSTNLSFVLIHAPLPLLEAVASLLRVKVPVKEGNTVLSGSKDLHSGKDKSDRLADLKACFDNILNKKLDEVNHVLEHRKTIYEPFTVTRKKSFVNGHSPEKMFSQSERSRMVFEILKCTSYGKRVAEKEKIGVERLIRSGVYEAAYPLHQSTRSPSICASTNDLNQKEVLHKHWGNLRSFRVQQPINTIKEYFGVKIALYFAWIGCYTKLLLLPSLLGVFWALSIPIVYLEQGSIKEVCDDTTTILCPKCDGWCDFRVMNMNCMMVKLTHIFDHWGVVFCALGICTWAQLFLQVWKRRQAKLCLSWGMMDAFYQEKNLRLDFKLRCTNYIKDAVTDRMEPYHTTDKKILNGMVNTLCVTFVAIFIVFTLFLSFWLRRHIELLVMYATNSYDTSTVVHMFLTSSTIGIFSLCIILIFNQVYQYAAYRIVEWECPRTQLEFDNSFILKIFSAQFVNTNSSFFFLAFVQPLFLRRWNFLHSTEGGMGVRSCVTNCFIELTIQMSTIFVGYQFIRGFAEYFCPLFKTRMKVCRSRISKWRNKNREDTYDKDKLTRWEEDYYLDRNEPLYLCYEYLEMIIQFGVLVLFTPVFPLAPLLALINNILEIRTDAIKYLSQKQRPVPEEAESIGIWTSILEFLAKLSIFINALVISFTSDFVPRLMWYLDTGSDHGYSNHSYSLYSTSHLAPFADSVKNDSIYFNQTLAIPKSCRYYGFYKPHCEALPSPSVDCVSAPLVEWSNSWWKNCVYRLLFAASFVVTILFIRYLIQKCLPDIPKRVTQKLERDKYLAKKRLISHVPRETGVHVETMVEPLMAADLGVSEKEKKR